MVNVSLLIAIAGTACVCLTFILTIFVAYTKATQWLSSKFEDIKITLAKFEITLTIHSKELLAHSARMDRYEDRYILIANRLQRILGRMDYDRRRAKGVVNGEVESIEPGPDDKGDGDEGT